MFSLGVYGLKTWEIDLEICFEEQILDAVIKLAPIGFLSILKMQYMIDSFFFLCDFKTKLFSIFFIFIY